MTVKMNGVWLPCEETDSHISIKKDDLIKTWVQQNEEQGLRVLNKNGYAYFYSNENGDIQNNGDGQGWMALTLRINLVLDIEKSLILVSRE